MDNEDTNKVEQALPKLDSLDEANEDCYLQVGVEDWMAFRYNLHYNMSNDNKIENKESNSSDSLNNLENDKSTDSLNEPNEHCIHHYGKLDSQRD